MIPLSTLLSGVTIGLPGVTIGPVCPAPFTFNGMTLVCTENGSTFTPNTCDSWCAPPGYEGSQYLKNCPNNLCANKLQQKLKELCGIHLKKPTSVGDFITAAKDEYALSEQCNVTHGMEMFCTSNVDANIACLSHGKLKLLGQLLDEGAKLNQIIAGIGAECLTNAAVLYLIKECFFGIVVHEIVAPGKAENATGEVAVGRLLNTLYADLNTAIAPPSSDLGAGAIAGIVLSSLAIVAVFGVIWVKTRS
jgi:hypothetical protein